MTQEKSQYLEELRGQLGLSKEAADKVQEEGGEKKPHG